MQANARGVDRKSGAKVTMAHSLLAKSRISSSMTPTQWPYDSCFSVE